MSEKAVKTSQMIKTYLPKKGKKQFILFEEKWKYELGVADEDFIKEYIIEKCGKYGKKKLLDALKVEPYIAYKVFNTWYNEGGNYYSELWFFDIGEEYLPVLVEKINGSSCYAMCRCGMGEEEFNYYTREEILDFVKTKKQKNAISSLLH
jgi:hypothetical protein